MSTKTFYVYELINPLTDSIFYIGKGTKENDGYSRLSGHLRDTRYYKAGKYKINHKYTTIAKIVDAGSQPILNVVFECAVEEEAYEKERELIAKYGRLDNGTGILTNHTDGGRGGEGYKHTEKHKKSLRENNPGGNATAKPVVAISPISGATILTFKSARVAAIQMTGKEHSRGNINQACSTHKNRISYGYYWRYANDASVDINTLNLNRLNPRNCRKVEQYDNGVLIKIWGSASDVCRHYGNHVATLSRYLKSGNIWNGYTWKYAT